MAKKLGNLHFNDQVLAFNNADIIVGLHGAGFANIPFCKPNTKIVELSSKTSGKMIENLAIKNNLIHRPLSCEAIRMDYSNQLGHINVPIKTLGEILNN